MAGSKWLGCVGLALVLALAAPGIAAARCNSADGIVAEDATELVTDPADDPAPPQDDAVLDAGARAGETIPIDLSRDLTSLTGLRGRYTDDAPVLGLRIENRPGFNPKTSCNALIPVLYKPAIETLPDGTLRASVEQKRFLLEFDPKTVTAAWIQDADPSGQFFWIFPSRFGASSGGKKAWPMTTAYAARYDRLAKGSNDRRWVAEAYMLAALRVYRRNTLNQGFPMGPLPTGADLQAALVAQLGYACDDKPDDLVCVAHRLIEMNETRPPNPEISRDAFRISDAIYENSGVSTGIRQLDFGTGNAQAKALVGKLLPKTVGKDARYRRPVRKWDVATVNRWYGKDGRIANSELSRPQDKALLVESHAAYIIEAAQTWGARLDKAYPDWPPAERTALGMFAIDLENVTGKALARPVGALGACEVMTTRNPASKDATSGNLALVLSQKRRVRNGVALLQTVPSLKDVDMSCLAPMLSPPAPAPPA
ncbi:hypothetical protein [Phenylobacterium aquaticum]|uniref:hypothetical protein n=1 Tax=Phenylobacterium aquaticum TaxID=1763816 RepID=UPI0026E9A6C8|nr:hypothetical protein [Phenylobacterium aquaticum]